jgi:hypothetical protein
MNVAGARPIELGCFTVQNGSVFVADQFLPLVAEVDGASGNVITVFTWALSPDNRGQPVSLDIAVLRESILVASPAAGGIVEISRSSGEAALIPLDAGVGTLIPGGDGAVWAIACPDWLDTGQDDPEQDRRYSRLDGRKRPVIWEEPAGAEVAGHSERAARGDFEDMRPATPIWRVCAGAARRIEADLEQPIMAAAGDELVGVCRLPADPVIKHVSPDSGSVSWHYPGTVVAIDAAGTIEAIGPVPSSGGVVAADDGRVWLLGFDDETESRPGPAPAIREVRADKRQMASGPRPLLRFERPVAVLDRFAIDIMWLRPPRDPRIPRTAPAAVIRFQPLDAGNTWTVEAAGLTDEAVARTGSGEIWLGNPGSSGFIVAAAGNPGVREVRVALDCRPWMPEPEIPAGFDPEAHERATADRLRRAFLREDASQGGDRTPSINGVSFDLVELRGRFPGREVIALFHPSGRPETRLGRRWRLYDELGNPADHRYAPVYLKEDIESGTVEIPPSELSIPGPDGVIWL